MALIKISRVWLLSFILFFITSISYAQEFEHPPKHVLQIDTRLNYIEGSPTWLIEIRDLKSGRVLPYMFDFTNYDNYWIAFSTERAYRITASTLKFGPHCVINNFCHLEECLIEGKSMYITLKGALTPNRKTSLCHVIKYKDYGFTIVEPNN